MKTEKVFASIFVIGFLLKILEWTGGSILVVFSLITISLLYFPFGFYFLSYKTIERQSLRISIFSGLLLSISIIGILFKLQYWTNAQILLYVGIFSALLVLTIIAIVRSRRTDESKDYYKNMIIRSVIIVVLAAIILFVW